MYLSPLLVELYFVMHRSVLIFSLPQAIPSNLKVCVRYTPYATPWYLFSMHNYFGFRFFSAHFFNWESLIIGKSKIDRSLIIILHYQPTTLQLGTLLMGVQSRMTIGRKSHSICICPSLGTLTLEDI